MNPSENPPNVSSSQPFLFPQLAPVVSMSGSSNNNSSNSLLSSSQSQQSGLFGNIKNAPTRPNTLFGGISRPTDSSKFSFKAAPPPPTAATSEITSTTISSTTTTTAPQLFLSSKTMPSTNLFNLPEKTTISSNLFSSSSTNMNQPSLFSSSKLPPPPPPLLLPATTTTAAATTTTNSLLFSQQSDKKSTISPATFSLFPSTSSTATVNAIQPESTATTTISSSSVLFNKPTNDHDVTVHVTPTKLPSQINSDPRIHGHRQLQLPKSLPLSLRPASSPPPPPPALDVGDTSTTATSNSSSSLSKPSKTLKVLTSPLEEKFTSIKIFNIPNDFYTSAFLRKHFSQFGEIDSLFLTRKDNIAVIHFKEQQSAIRAKTEGCQFSPTSQPVAITLVKKRIARPILASGTAAAAVGRVAMTSSLPATLPPAPPPVVSTAAAAASVGSISQVSESIKEEKVVLTTSSSSNITDKNRRQCNTIGERLALLESRDKLIRKRKGANLIGGTGANKNLKESTNSAASSSSLLNRSMSKVPVLTGTGQDMCSEKERYMRMEQNRISIYECNSSNEFDHQLAITEYSRSSADQEEPLSHDLRTPDVLIRTMNYLLSGVANRASTDPKEPMRWGRWYEFLWNRTRAMRKEITQQRLNEEVAIELIEKTARFHIFCAERLCEEEANAFDAKINSENLNQCLQSLRELYHDAKARDVYSNNEAEFRAYMILMNLMDSNILSEVELLPGSVRLDDRMKDAMSAYYALYNNNYIRFFKIVDKTTFFNACLLHRYFFKVRAKALNVMANAFFKAKTKVSVEVTASFLMNQLKMENVAEVQLLCSHLGYVVEDDHRILLTQSPTPTDERYSSPRAIKLIESKVFGKRIGELFNNGELLEPGEYLHSPHFSFDSSGCFIGVWPQDGGGAAVVIDEEESNEEFPPPPPPPTVPTISASTIHQTATQILFNVINEILHEELQSICLPTITNHIDAVHIFNGVFSDVLFKMTRDVAHVTVQQEILANEITQEIYHNLLNNEVQVVCQETLCEIQTERSKMMESVGVELIENVIHQIVQSELKTQVEILVEKRNDLFLLSEFIFDDLLNILIEQLCLSTLSIEIVHHRQRLRIFKQWKFQSKEKLFNRQALFYLPPCPSIRDNFTTFEKMKPTWNSIPTKSKLRRTTFECDEIETFRTFSFDNQQHLSIENLPPLAIVTCFLPQQQEPNSPNDDLMKEKIKKIIKWLLIKMKNYPNDRLIVKSFTSCFDCANYLNQMNHAICLLLLSEDLYLELTATDSSQTTISTWPKSWIQLNFPQVLQTATSKSNRESERIIEFYGNCPCGQWSIQLENHLMNLLDKTGSSFASTSTPSTTIVPFALAGERIGLNEIVQKWMFSRFFEVVFADKSMRDAGGFVDQSPIILIETFNCCVDQLFSLLSSTSASFVHHRQQGQFNCHRDKLKSPKFPFYSNEQFLPWTCALSVWQRYLLNLSPAAAANNNNNNSLTFPPWPMVIRQCEQMMLNAANGFVSSCQQRSPLLLSSGAGGEKQNSISPCFEIAPWTEMLTSVLYNRLHQWTQWISVAVVSVGDELSLSTFSSTNQPITFNLEEWHQICDNKWACSLPLAEIGTTMTHGDCVKHVCDEYNEQAWHDSLQMSRIQHCSTLTIATTTAAAAATTMHEQQESFADLHEKMQSRLNDLKRNVARLSTSMQQKFK